MFIKDKGEPAHCFCQVLYGLCCFFLLQTTIMPGYGREAYVKSETEMWIEKGAHVLITLPGINTDFFALCSPISSRQTRCC